MFNTARKTFRFIRNRFHINQRYNTCPPVSDINNIFYFGLRPVSLVSLVQHLPFCFWPRRDLSRCYYYLKITFRVPLPLLATDIRKIFQLLMEYYRIFKMSVQLTKYSLPLCLYCSVLVRHTEQRTTHLLLILFQHIVLL